MKSYTETFKESFPDAKELSEVQRKSLLNLMYFAFTDLRSLSHFGNNGQVFDLADAFHNLPLWLNLEIFSFEHFRMYLMAYHEKHESHLHNYLELLNKIENGEEIFL